MEGLIMKMGFLFGAGAEVDYDMPLGGQFALDIFRQDPSKAKSQFKEMRDSIDASTHYAGNWLPDDYQSKNIFTFGKSVYENIIRDTIEHNRNKVIQNINRLDELAESVRQDLESKKQNINIDESFKRINGQSVDNLNMTQKIKFREEFREGNKLFASSYFSSLLMAYKNGSETTKKELGTIILAILQLTVGALSESLARKINDTPFDKKDDEIDLFDDLGDIVQINYTLAGASGLEYLLCESYDLENSSVLNSDENTVLGFAQKLLEKIFSDVIDYKSLIDSYWHYLYCPKDEWSKFCRIAIFLMIVRNYIDQQCLCANSNKVGYYDDLKNFLCRHKDIEVTVATTNYTELISHKLGDGIHFLNGSTNKWYDPYINRIGTKDDLDKEEKHFLVPLLFTQSGTKPMTSIHMSKEYVNVFDSFQNADAIFCVGYGFNPDDEHINGIIRELIDHGKQIYLVKPKRDILEQKVVSEIAQKLKTTHRENIQVLLVDRNRCVGDKSWIQEVYKDFLK